MRELGDYRIDRLLGRGATAQVYLAFRQRDNFPVALKVFHPGLWDREDLKRRALSEVSTALALRHSNIIQIFEPHLDLDPPAMALEFVDGVSLEEFQGRLPYVLPEVSVLVLIEILRALEHAHAQSVVHRDLKPANILIGSDGRVLVGDFGLARMTDVSRLTLSGTLLGSPDYMAPEQARGEISTPKSDLFSAASVLYFLITGTRPFARSSALATLSAVNDAQPEPATRRNPKISPALARILKRGLARDAQERFSSAREFRETLENYLTEISLTSPEFTFARWIRESSTVTVEAMKSIARALTGRAEALAGQGLWDAAMEALSHLSLVAPETEAIPRLMDQFERARDRERRRALLWRVSSVAALFLILLGGGALWWQRSPIPVHRAGKSPAVVDRLPTTMAAATVVAKPPVRRSPAKTGRVRFDVPAEIQVYWDNALVVDHVEGLPAQRPGRHRIRLLKQGAAPIVQSVVVKADEPTIIRVR